MTDIHSYLRNLYQQIAGSLNYATQLQPELMFSVSQLSRVMSYRVLVSLVHSSGRAAASG